MSPGASCDFAKRTNIGVVGRLSGAANTNADGTGTERLARGFLGVLPRLGVENNPSLSSSVVSKLELSSSTSPSTPDATFFSFSDALSMQPCDGFPLFGHLK